MFNELFKCEEINILKNEEIKEEDKQWAICPKCSNDFTLKIHLNQLKKLETHCFQCGHKWYDTIDRYIELLTKNKPTKKQNICNKHNLSFKSYCLHCQKHLCQKCEISHIHKSIEQLNTININSYKNELIKSKTFLNNHFPLIRKLYLDYLNNLVHEFEKEYQNSYDRNVKVLNLIEMIINTYSPEYPNYYIENSIKLIDNFHIEPFEIPDKKEKINFEEIQKVENYLGFYTILNESKKDLYFFSSFKNTKTITFNKDVYSSVQHFKDDILIFRNIGDKTSFYHINSNTIEDIDPFFDKNLIMPINDETLLVNDNKDENILFEIWKVKESKYICEHKIQFKDEYEDITNFIPWKDDKIILQGMIEVMILDLSPPYNVIKKKTFNEEQSINSLFLLNNKEELVLIINYQYAYILNLKSFQIVTQIKLFNKRDEISFNFQNDITMLQINNTNKLIIFDENNGFIINLNTYQYVGISNISSAKSTIKLNDRYLCSYNYLSQQLCVFDLNLCVYSYKKIKSKGDLINFNKNEFIIAYKNYDQIIDIWNY